MRMPKVFTQHLSEETLRRRTIHALDAAALDYTVTEDGGVRVENSIQGDDSITKLLELRNDNE